MTFYKKLKTIKIFQEDTDNLEYYADLRERLIECIHVIFIFVKENNRTADFKIYVCQILDFINKINKPEFSPSVVKIKLLN